MRTKRLSAHWISKKNIRLKKTNLPRVKDKELILKVESCAICGSDLKIYFNGNKRVKSGQIIGHEISGSIVKIGKKVKNFNLGQRLAVGADVGCGRINCEYCKRGSVNSCDLNYAIGHQFEGGFNQFMKINKTTLLNGPLTKIPKHISFDEAALSEPLACCLNGYEKSNVQRNKIILIIGAGPIGYLLSALGKLYKSKLIILADYSLSRLRFAKKNLKNISLINLKKKDLVKEVRRLTKNKLCDYIFTACNSIEAQQQSIDLVSKNGVINFFGGLSNNNKKKLELDSNLIHYKEASITGSHGSTPTQNKYAVKLISRKLIDVKPLITDLFSIKDIHLAYNKAISGKGMKVVIKPNQ